MESAGGRIATFKQFLKEQKVQIFYLFLPTLLIRLMRLSKGKATGHLDMPPSVCQINQGAVGCEHGAGRVS